MKKFRLSTDILSPVHSDISLNDSSTFSFGSTSDTSGFGKEREPVRCGSLENDSSVDSFCKTTLKASAAAFDVVVNDIKKQSNINAEKEERFKESYKNLKHSMDELYKKVSHSSILSPVSSDINFIKENEAEKVPAQKKTNAVPDVLKNLKAEKESIKSKPVSQISNKKSKIKDESRFKKNNSEQSKNVCLLKESTENSKHSKKKSYLQKEKISKTVSSSTQTCEHFEPGEVYRKETLRNYYSEKQRRPEISNVLPASENKHSSIESSIQIAISMEMDNLRRFVLEQNMSLRKDLLKLRETTKKQKEVTGYLFSVIEALMEENKKLLSNRNKT